QARADEIHAPSLVGPRRCGEWHPRPARQLLARFRAHRQILLVVEAIDAFRIHRPPFAFQQYRQPAIAEAHADRGQFLEPLAERVLAIARRAIPERAVVHSDEPRGPALAETVDRLRPFRQCAACARLHSFFRTISCRMWRSSVRSATTCFNFAFSWRSD